MHYECEAAKHIQVLHNNCSAQDAAFYLAIRVCQNVLESYFHLKN